MNKKLDSSESEIKGQLLGSLLLFTKVFFKLRTGKEFRVSKPIGRESHHITICKALTKVMRGEIKRLIINVPPRYGKSELAIHFVAWCIARYPDCNFMYLSHAYSLAARQTQIVRDILTLPDYQALFGVKLKSASTAKHDFETMSAGSVYAAGMEGTILGRGAGIKHCDRFGGCLLIDDAHEADEAQSDIKRKRVTDRYDGTLRGRRNDGINTPTVVIAQRLHEEDICGHLQEKDYEGWDVVEIPALDDAENALDPVLHTKEQLLLMKEHNTYTFWSQMQQKPQPPGGGIYLEEDFLILEQEPELLMTFITADTAETDKQCNDATVFSLFGLYKIKYKDLDVGDDLYALHWLDCIEVWVEPKELEEIFMTFYSAALRRDVKPSFVGIEAASTGTTLISKLKDMQGMNIIKINHKGANVPSKTTRFLNMQDQVSKKLITLPFGAKHTKMCVTHMKKITANNVHARDDICDTVQMAVEIALVDQTLIKRYIYPKMDNCNNILKKLANNHRKTQQLRGAREWQN